MSEPATALNPFTRETAPPPKAPDNALIRTETARAVEEIRAGMLLARQFPRDEIAAMDRILKACTRTTLAEHALYAYPKGDTTVTGPSIRLAEALAQNWGHLIFGIRELSQGDGSSTIEAFAHDLQTNTRQVKVFQVPHTRYSRSKGLTKLTDPRDVYEQTANQGARRLRACILGVIPGDVVEAAVKQAELTLAHAGGAPEEQLKKLIEAFKELGVDRPMLERRLGHRLDSIIMAEVLNLRKIYSSLKDGMTGIDDWFEKPDGAAAVNKVLQQGAEAPREAKPKPVPSAPLRTGPSTELGRALSNAEGETPEEGR